MLKNQGGSTNSPKSPGREDWWLGEDSLLQDRWPESTQTQLCLTYTLTKYATYARLHLFTNLYKHMLTHHDIHFLSLGSNIPQVRLDLDDSPGSGAVGEPYWLTVDKFITSSCYSFKYHFGWKRRRSRRQAAAGSITHKGLKQNIHTSPVSEWVSDRQHCRWPKH